MDTMNSISYNSSLIDILKRKPRHLCHDQNCISHDLDKMLSMPPPFYSTNFPPPLQLQENQSGGHGGGPRHWFPLGPKLTPAGKGCLPNIYQLGPVPVMPKKVKDQQLALKVQCDPVCLVGENMYPKPTLLKVRDTGNAGNVHSDLPPSNQPAHSQSIAKLINENSDDLFGPKPLEPVNPRSGLPEKYWSHEDDSIGELAIKLASVTLSDQIGADTELKRSHLSGVGDMLQENYQPRECSAEQHPVAKKSKSASATQTYPNTLYRKGGKKMYYDRQPCPKKSMAKPSDANAKKYLSTTQMRKRDNGSASKPMNRSKEDPACFSKFSESSVHPDKHAGSPKPKMINYSKTYKCLDWQPVWNTLKYYNHRPLSEQALSCGSMDETRISEGRQQSRRYKAPSSCGSSSSGGAKYTECVFCKTNGETAFMYRSHVLKDERGRTVCKVLQQYVCPICGATGVNAHTMKYCPSNKNPPEVATMTTLKSMRSSTGRKRQVMSPDQTPSGKKSSCRRRFSVSA